jgi:hypothetical protein
MNYIQVFKDAFNLLRRTKLVWVFSTLIFLLSFFSYALRFINDFALMLTMMLLYIWLIYISFRAQCGLIYTINQALYNEQVTFEEGWNQGKTILFRIFGVLIILFLFFIAFFTLFLVWKKEFLMIFFGFVLVPLWVVWIDFAICGIVINRIKPFRAVWTGFLITTNNIIKIFILSQIFEFTRLILLGVFIVVILSTPLKIHIPYPLPLDYSTYQKLIANPIISGFSQLLYLLITPLSSIVWVMAYNQFTSEIAYPGLATQRAKS